MCENNQLDEYTFIKKLISTYFTYFDHSPYDENKINQRKEYRILPFLTSILENGKVPENVKMISWNYDNQIELAAKYKTQDSFKYLKGFTAWPNTINSENISYTNEGKLPFLIHLNGLAGFKYDKMKFAEESITPFVEFAATEHDPLLSFSWEASSDEILPTFNTTRLNLAKQMVTGTEYLVIVGYSFPFFNRSVDKILLEVMNSSLIKIYYQEPNSEIGPEDLINKFDLNISIDKIKMIRDVRQYHIPHEL